LRFGGELRGVEEAAKRDARGGIEEDADLLNELVLVADPGLARAGSKRFDSFAAYAGDGILSDEREERRPLESDCVEVLDRVRSGSEEGCVQGPGYGFELGFKRRHAGCMVAVYPRPLRATGWQKGALLESWVIRTHP
jgi:hypothetical protein